jgi:glutathione peroxidase
MLKKIKYIFLKLFSPKEISSRPKNMIKSAKSFFDFKMNSIDGKEIDFSQFKGKKILLVNTASECGYTPQYDELELLYQTHKDKLIILGFPSNDFGAQEPGSNEEIGAFCRKNFGVTFQLFEKSDVIGKNQNPIYQWLTHKELNGWNDEKPNWNFWKYFISENGELLKLYSAAVNPMSDEIVGML